jgi:hypothetical protein
MQDVIRANAGGQFGRQMQEAGLTPDQESGLDVRKVARSSDCFVLQAHEQVADAFAIGAFFVAVVSGGLTERTLAPIGWFGSDCVRATAALLVTGLAAAAVCDTHVVAGATAFCTARNGDLAFHPLMIRLCGCVYLFHPEHHGEATEALTSRAGRSSADVLAAKVDRFLLQFSGPVPSHS